MPIKKCEAVVGNGGERRPSHNDVILCSNESSGKLLRRVVTSMARIVFARLFEVQTTNEYGAN